jgi:hypothetical protein
MLQKFKELFKKNMTVNFNDTIQSTLKASMAASFELVFRRRDQLKEGMQKMNTDQLPQNKLTVCANTAFAVLCSRCHTVLCSLTRWTSAVM